MTQYLTSSNANIYRPCLKVTETENMKTTDIYDNNTNRKFNTSGQDHFYEGRIGTRPAALCCVASGGTGLTDLPARVLKCNILQGCAEVHRAQR